MRQSIEPLGPASELWLAPGAMIENWGVDPSKIARESKIADWVGPVGSIADLGCGSGRMGMVTDFQNYEGFDLSLPMLAAAHHTFKGRENMAFTIADVFEFSPDQRYDVVLLYDVAVHQKDPIAAIMRILSLWEADRYIFTLLVGNVREELLLSTVVSFSEVAKMVQILGLASFRSVIREQSQEKFFWVLFEVHQNNILRDSNV